jgi:aspartate/glutamate racemase
MEEQQLVIGIIGGLGAEASAKLYLDLVNETISYTSN